jgi:hypothetical protein
MQLTKAVNLYPKPHVGKTLQEIAVATSVVQLSAFDLQTHYVLVEVKTASVYVTFDNSTPSSTNGHSLAAGYRDFWSRQTAQAAKFIQNSGAARVVASPFTD